MDCPSRVDGAKVTAEGIVEELFEKCPNIRIEFYRDDATNKFSGAEKGGCLWLCESEYSDDDEAAAEDKVDSVSFVEEFSCDKVDSVEEEKRRGYVNNDSTDDDHEGFFVEEESCGS
ncbi:hypothetical protein Tco_1506617 [Tanacetum coccineum]